MSIPDPVRFPVPSRPAPAALPAVISGAPPLAWREGGHWHERRRLERLVQRCFASDHGVHITHFLPRLFGLWQGDMPLAAVGVNRAAEGPLFQECYLDSSAEAFLSRYLGRPVAREAIADPARLGEDQADWGRYYQHHPRVMAGDLRLAHAVLTERGLPGPARPAEVGHVPVR